MLTDTIGERNSHYFNNANKNVNFRDNHINENHYNNNHVPRNAQMLFQLSASEQKLIEKVLLLAERLEAKAAKQYPAYDFACWHKRRLLSLIALGMVSQRSGLAGRLLQVEKIVELLGNWISRIPMALALQIIKVPGGLEHLKKDLVQAQQLKFLHLLRLRLRAKAGKHSSLKIKTSTDVFNYSTSDLKVFLRELERRRKQKGQQAQQAQAAQEEAYLHRLRAEALNLHLQHRQTEAQLSSQLRELRLQDPAKVPSTLRRFLHAWRCLLNFRMVRARTRRLAKSAVLGRWKRVTRVDKIASIFYGKKVKLRSLNRWFSRCFGRTKDQQLVTKLNDFVAKKRRRMMYQHSRNFSDLSAKALLQHWRLQIQVNHAVAWNSMNVKRLFLQRMQGLRVIGQGLGQTSRLYNEIRLLKNAFYQWFSTVVPDRLAFTQANRFVRFKRFQLGRNALETWIRNGQRVALLIHKQCTHLQLKQIQSTTRVFTQWRHLQVNHSARFIWTENFRSTEEMRDFFKRWRTLTQAQILADTRYQVKLAKGTLGLWSGLFEERQERRFQLKRKFKLWRSFTTSRPSLRYFAGQQLLRRLSSLHAPPQTQSQALERLSTASCSPLEVDYGLFLLTRSQGSQFALRIVYLCKWRRSLNHLADVDDQYLHFYLQKLRKMMQIWRLRAAYLNVARSQPQRCALRLIRQLRRHVRTQRDKALAADTQLFHYYAHRAGELERRYFKLWEKAFQQQNIAEHCCQQLLHQLQSRQQARILQLWQLHTVGRIYEKCSQITRQHAALRQWRSRAKADGQNRKTRMIHRIWVIWLQARRIRKLNGAERNVFNRNRKQSTLATWRTRLNRFVQQPASQATDFYFIVSALHVLNHWRRRVAEKRILKNRMNLKISLLRPPQARKPRLDANIFSNPTAVNSSSSISLSNIVSSDSKSASASSLNIAELSV